MAQNRVIPFGYCMANGEYIVHPQEQETVLKIFTQYAEGASYKLLAEELTLAQVPYLPEKTTWNKNMIARILQNEQYRGQDKYPRLLSEEQWEASQKAMKPFTPTFSPEIKLLKPLLICGVCGGNVVRKMTPHGKERWRCGEDLSHIHTTLSDTLLLEQVQKGLVKPTEPEKKQGKQTTMALIQKENYLNQVKIGKEMEPDEFLAEAISLVQEKYQMCENTNIALEHLPVHEVEKILLKGNQILAIHLKNKTKIEMRDPNESDSEPEFDQYPRA